MQIAEQDNSTILNAVVLQFTQNPDRLINYLF